MARKDVEDELRAVDAASVGGGFDVALLHWGKIAVENNERRFMRGGFGANFVQFAAPDERGGVGGFAHLVHGACNFCAGAARELYELSQGFATLFASGHSGDAASTLPGHANQQGAFGIRSGVLGLHAWK